MCGSNEGVEEIKAKLNNQIPASNNFDSPAQLFKPAVLEVLKTSIFVQDIFFILFSFIAKLSQAKPQLQLSWLALASLNFT